MPFRVRLEVKLYECLPERKVFRLEFVLRGMKQLYTQHSFSARLTVFKYVKKNESSIYFLETDIQNSHGDYRSVFFVTGHHIHALFHGPFYRSFFFTVRANQVSISMVVLPSSRVLL